MSHLPPYPSSSYPNVVIGKWLLSEEKKEGRRGSGDAPLPARML